ncbi:hypothetical protein P3602_12990 [Vibrio parahaemolyticus]|nr:hypothetical protein [Vibrio parahaemolyticus]MCR9647670.1 hypothetical protein [Vibrio parahaemolyticus]MCR9767916.1 hypothetical protein [Vibrio parahaemolyticus]MCR9799428.1 hypothetical protein [Vibrio parahaemolyticus]MDF4283879.1 hypothetical protein [Vibrio parahaemolyticus]MDF4315219.1 hypothetical protein [Vibrio parahaemolyticus]
MMIFICLSGKEHRYSPEDTNVNISFYAMSLKAYLTYFINA